MLRRTLIVIFLATMAVPVVASPCLACSCAASGDPAADRRDDAKRADLIFTGVAKSEKVVQNDPEFEGDETLLTKFRVGRTHKGHHRRWRTIESYASGATCGFDFEVGRRYTVFAYKHKDGSFWTDLCSGTKRGRINPDNYGLDD